MDGEDPPEHKESLWLLIVGPTIWAVHFLLCYFTAAVWCAKVAGLFGPLEGVRVAVSIYTLVALTGIGWSMHEAYQRHQYGKATVPHDFATAADRHRFLGFATLLLSGLSFVAVLYVGGVVFFVRSC